MLLGLRLEPLGEVTVTDTERNDVTLETISPPNTLRVEVDQVFYASPTDSNRFNQKFGAPRSPRGLRSSASPQWP